MLNEKKNNSGNLQAMIPKGNGPKSGEYTFDCESNFLTKFLCTKEILKSKLIPSQILAIRKYTDYKFGTGLNKRLRDKTYSESDLTFLDNLVSSIESFSLNNSLKVFRGLHLSKELYVSLYKSKFENNEPVIDQDIFSSSRDKNRAIIGTYNEKNEVKIIIELELPKGYHALPIESISLVPSEKEILLHKPIFLISSINDFKIDDDIIKLIKGVIL